MAGVHDGPTPHSTKRGNLQVEKAAGVDAPTVFSACRLPRFVLWKVGPSRTPTTRMAFMDMRASLHSPSVRFTRLWRCRHAQCAPACGTTPASLAAASLVSASMRILYLGKERFLGIVLEWDKWKRCWWELHLCARISIRLEPT